MKRIQPFILFLSFLFLCHIAPAQQQGSDGQLLMPAPPMGWMTWNGFGENINEKIIKEIADAMERTGMVTAGYHYIMIDDGWQGGRDNRNHIIPDPVKFPGGIKALADYVHSKGIKLGIYSDAAPLTCAGYTASLHFERQDAKTFASWGIDYLKYDYCGAPEDSATAKVRYKTMADALRKSGRDIAFSICEWGDRQPWYWAAQAGGQLWRTTGDGRDKWKRKTEKSGEGIMEILDVNAELADYAGPGHWNDPDMLMIGLYGKKGPSSALGGTGCNDTEYRSQMSLWSIMAAPLVATNDVRNMNAATTAILLNAEVIAVDQDPLGKQGVRMIRNDTLNVFVKPLSDGDVAIAILNRSEVKQTIQIDFSQLGLTGNYAINDLWEHRPAASGKKWKGTVESHETKLFRLKKK